MADTTPDPAKQLTDAVIRAVRAELSKLATPAQTFSQGEAIAYSGLARSTWFRLRSLGQLPEPVDVPVSGPRWRRKDLDAWLDKLKPRRARPKARSNEEVA